MADLIALRDGWDQAAREDAMFNILTLVDHDGGRWDPDEFFQVGRNEIADALEHLDGLGLRSDRRSRALDFGCGVGRLTQALAEHYRTVDGVDLSGEMIERAQGHNRHGVRVRYQVNDADLSMFRAGMFDLVFTSIVLQHIPSQLAWVYVSEFVRVLHPKGIAVFQVWEGADLAHLQPWLSMYCHTRDQVEEWVDGAGGCVLDVQPIYGEGSVRYTVGRA